MKKTIWELAPRKYDDLIDQLLFNRGILDVGALDKKFKFFEPNFSQDLHSPFLMKNLEKAVKRLALLKERRETVGIFADYDADGIPGAALLYRAFKAIGIKSYVYIPNREGGYGLSEEGIDYLRSRGCSLIVTVDLGIRSLSEAKYCKKVGIDLIITDHHLPGEELPEVEILVNPKQKGDKYPYKELCGCGVAYKLVQGLSKTFPDLLTEAFLKWNLDLVAISTISDVVPLSGENRVLAKYGLIVLGKTKNVGLAALIKTSGITDAKITAYHVGFQIGPRINAPGRIDHATKSFELLVTEDPKEAKALAMWLNEKNEERQAMMEEVLKEAIAKIEKEELFKNRIIICVGKWQKGVIGPSASKLVEKYNRPVILFAEDKDTYTGSARSLSGINIVELFEANKDEIAKFGGHKQAAGITVSCDKFASFCEKIIKTANETISDESLLRRLRIDAEVSLNQLTKGLYEKILQFEPFGMENPKPVFSASDVSLDQTKFVGANSNHFSAIVGDSPHRLKMIQFNFPYDKALIDSKLKYDLAFSLSLDEWQGEQHLSLKVQDIRLQKEKEY